MKSKWIFLSYVLSDALSAYGNGKRITIDRIKQISKGDSSNNSFLYFPSHFGTHIDFPFHFDANGFTGEKYKASYFVHSHICLAELKKSTEGLLITPEDLKNIPTDENITFLLFKTGLCYTREKDEYWNANFGFAPESASCLKEKMPQLQMIGFDSISLSSWQHRETGRVAHRKFLIENNILIVEDMDLRLVDAKTEISKLVVSPLLFEKADGAPVTVFAEITNEN